VKLLNPRIFGFKEHLVKKKQLKQLKQQEQQQQQHQHQHQQHNDPPAFDDAQDLQAPTSWEIAVDSSGENLIPADIRKRVYAGTNTPTLPWCVTQYISQTDPMHNAAPDPNAKLRFQVFFNFCLQGDLTHTTEIQALFVAAFNEYFANCKNYIVKPVLFFNCGAATPHYDYTLDGSCREAMCRSFNVEPVVPINIQLKFNPASFTMDEANCYVKYSIVHELLHRIYANKNGVVNSLCHDNTGHIWQTPGADAKDNDANVFHYSRNHFIPCKLHDATAKSFIDEQVQSYWIMSCRHKLGRGALENAMCYSV